MKTGCSITASPQATSMMEKIFKKAWAKIEVEIKVMEIVLMEEQVRTEVNLMMQKGGEDWRRFVHEDIVGAELPDATERLQDEVAMKRPLTGLSNHDRRGSSDLDEDYGPEDLANMMPPEDPLHALVAAHELPRQQRRNPQTANGEACHCNHKTLDRPLRYCIANFCLVLE
jgi:hypothetical protein